MAATIVEKLSEESAGPVLYFFIRNIIDANKTAVAALRDWLAQLLVYNPQLQTELLQCSKTTRLSALSTEDLWRYLMMGAASVPRCYIVADALDEMDDSEAFAKAIVDLGYLKPDTVKVVCTSRPSPQVQRPFVRANTMQIRLDSESVDRDILAYVDLRLTASGVPAEYHERVKAAVPGRANGLFLYARLAMDTLVADPARLDTALSNMPLDLASMYKELLKENAERTGVTWYVQKAILQFATHATRPLRLLEIADCLFHCYDIADDLGETKELVRRSCGNLLEVLPNETVSVIHHSLTEFLCGSSGDESQESGVTHRDLALLCIAYMKKTLPEYPPGEENINTHSDLEWRFNTERNERKSHFSEYAEANWNIHIRRSTEAGADQTPTIDAIDSILGDESKQMRKSVCIAHSSDFSLHIPKESTTLQAALRFQLHRYAHIVSSRLELDVTSTLHSDYSPSIDSSPLVLACEAGYMDVVQALLERGFDIESTAYLQGLNGPHVSSGERVTALKLAAWTNNVPLIQLLLRYGAVMPELPQASLFKGGDDTGILGRAAKHLQACEILAPLSTDARAVFKALEVAIREQPGNVKLLAAHPLADLKMRSYGCTPLHKAAESVSAASVRYLLQANADVNDERRYHPDTDGMQDLLQDRYVAYRMQEAAGRVALHCWAESSGTQYSRQARTDEETTSMFQLLVDAGGNVNSTDDAGNTPLHIVESPLAARLLIAAGANLVAVNKEGKTPIRLLREKKAYTYDAPLMKLLDQYEAKHGRQTLPGDLLSPLIKVIRAGNATEALKIAQTGDQLNVTDEHGNGALHYAAAMRHNSFDSEYYRGDDAKAQAEDTLQLIRCLGTSGLDINARNSRGQTPLHLFGRGPAEWRETERARPASPVDALKVMLDLGADLTITDKDGMTPLLTMIVNFHGNWARVPCSGCGLYHRHLGPSLVKYTNYPSALLALDFMLERGAYLEAQDHQGRTALFAAVTHTDSQHLVPWVIKHGVLANVADKNGDTVYNVIVQKGGVRQDIFDMILPLHLDVKYPNHGGRTALHSLCSLAQGTNRGEQELREQADARREWKRVPIFHDVVQQFSLDDINRPDNDGFTPLLLAARANADLCCRLLRLGADPTAVTNRAKQNVFHIASESGQANILGAVASYMIKRGDAESERLAMLINATDGDGKTPLGYAAASGQENAIRILVDFGACPDAAMCLRGCAAFESSQAKLTIDACAYPSGLEDILNIISEWKAKPEDVDQAIIAAAKNKHDYTVATLSSWRDGLGMPPGSSVTSPDVAASLHRRALNTNSQRKELCNGALQVDNFERLMANREYSLVVEHATPAMLTQILADGKTILHRLVASGCINMLQRILSKDIIDQLVDALRVPGKYGISECLVLEACRRQQPSLRLLSLLVDDLGMDAAGLAFYNRGNLILDRGDDDPSADTIHACTLHVLARGNQWWHGALGIPYIVGKGVDVDFEVRGGRAIAAAIARQSEHPLFHMTCAVASLLQYGADITPKNAHDNTCFQLARNSPRVLDLLRPLDDRPDNTKLLSAIEDNDLAAVQALLEKGVDANRPVPCQGYQVQYLDHKMSPLACALLMMRIHTGDPDGPGHYFATNTSSDVSRVAPNGLSTNEDIIQLLLQHGADLNTAFRSSPSTSIVLDMLRAGNGSKSRLYKDKVLALLQLPQLDVNHVSHGYYPRRSSSTLLEEACDLANADFAQALLDRGASLCVSLTAEQLAADPVAPPASTALHALLESRGHWSERLDSPVWDRLVTDASINRRPDHNGLAPLHHAVLSKHRSKFALQLLAARVDPWALTSSGTNLFHIILSAGSETFEKMHILEHLVTLPGALAAVSSKPAGGIGSKKETALRMLFHHGEMINFRHHYHAKQVRLLQILDGLGVDWAELDEDGQSLMHLAAKNTNVTHFQFLMDKGLDPRLEDAKHQTPLDLAAERKATNILSLFEKKA